MTSPTSPDRESVAITLIELGHALRANDGEDVANMARMLGRFIGGGAATADLYRRLHTCFANDGQPLLSIWPDPSPAAPTTSA